MRTEEEPNEPIRSERELLEEILHLTRKFSNRKVFREQISTDTVKELLAGYISLHDQQAMRYGGYSEALDVLKRMHEPIRRIVKGHGEYSKDAGELYTRFSRLTHEVVDEEEKHDDVPIDDDDSEIPF